MKTFCVGLIGALGTVMVFAAIGAHHARDWTEFGVSVGLAVFITCVFGVLVYIEEC